MNLKTPLIWSPIFLFLILQACIPSTENQRTPPPNKTITPTVSDTLTPTETPMPQISASLKPDADVVFVKAINNQDGTWEFHVTVEHPDTGWENYADGWDIVLPDGTVLKSNQDSTFTRLLLHPHVNEQPFTRSQTGMTIPEGTTEVRVRAHDIVNGYGGQEVIVDLTKKSGDNFEVERNN